MRKSRESYSVWWFSLLVSLTALFVAFAECSLFIFQQAVFWPHRALVALCSCLQVRWAGRSLPQCPLLLWGSGSRVGAAVVAHGLSRGMWSLPRPGVEPVYSALAGGFLATGPSGKCQGISKFTVIFPHELWLHWPLISKWKASLLIA